MDKIGAYTGSADSNSEFTEGDPGTGTPATEVDGGWLNAVQRELVKVIESMGLTLSSGDDEQLWQALQKVYGKTFAGNPQGNVAADVLRERCWDTSTSPPTLYIATAADGTVGGTTWTILADVATDRNNVFTKEQRIESGSAQFRFVETDASADHGKWLLKANSQEFQISAANDAGTVETVALRITRSGTAITDVQIDGESIYAESSVVPLGGDFDGVATATASRKGNSVTITTHGPVTYDSSMSSATSGAGVVPSAFRPSDSLEFCVNSESGGLTKVKITSAGTIITEHRDWTGSLNSLNGTPGFSISYVIT